MVAQHRQPATGPHPFGPDWDRSGFKQLGWQLLPLRGFLGVTFLYAALQKLANPDYLRSSAPSSFVAQSHALEATSPIAPLLRLALHAPTLVALLIAFGELAVALGIIVGLWTRVAALGGLLLSLTFFLTVSWSTTPYFYGSDIVFVFAWSVFLLCGAGGVLSLDAWIGPGAEAASRGAPGQVDAIRRQILVGARSAGLLAVFGGLLGGVTAWVGRAAGGTKHNSLQTLTSRSAPSPTTSPTSTSTSAPTHRAHRRAASQPSGTAIGQLSDVPVGQGREFVDPGSGATAWVVRPSASDVRAFSAICTHAGCTVNYDSANDEFVCPCHGGTYSAQTGAVLAGPPPAPLSQIPVHVVDGEIRVD